MDNEDAKRCCMTNTWTYLLIMKQQLYFELQTHGKIVMFWYQAIIGGKKQCFRE